MDTSSSFLEAEASSSNDNKYDVYLSFRGEDTRKGFTDHLYSTLKGHRINVYVNELERGEAITSQLHQAIERSRISVIVFSRGYADSRSCLEELVKIMECRRTRGQMVLPIFYDVELSDVRKQTGSFEQAFQKHEKCFPQETVRLWRGALAEAADLAGMVSSSTVADGFQGKFVREVVRNITDKLNCINCTNLDVAKYLVGIDSRVQEISNYLEVGGLNDVRIIGIWGMGGMGKTEVAKAIFNKYNHCFDGKSFLLNVNEKKLIDCQEQLLFDILQQKKVNVHVRERKLIGLQEQLRFDILQRAKIEVSIDRKKKIEVSSVDEGTDKIEKSLGSIRALVIFDDIDLVEQLDALAIKRDTFGLGSRIIVTTRDKHLLRILEVDMIYTVRAMNKEEALELLSWHAFGNRWPNEGYLKLAREVVDECGGLPLALKVIGRFLFAKSTSAWESELDKIKRMSRGDIYGVFKINFDNLTDGYVKAIFLDISCFFIGMNKNYVMRILDGCDLYPEIGFGELFDRSFVTGDERGNLMVHELIQDMGKGIVRAESPNEPGKRSRLWNHQDVTHVLRNNSGTKRIEGLALDLQESDKPCFSTAAFKQMQNLRLLKLNYVELTGSYKHLSRELRWLCWHGFPLEVIPKDFYQSNLVAIDLSNSKLIRIWEDSDVVLEKLKFLNLSHSSNLVQTPDFSKLPNLEELILKDCENLFVVHSSIGVLKRLALVDLQNCKNLKYLPSLHGLNSLRTLVLSGCHLMDANFLKDVASLVYLEKLDLEDNLFHFLPSLSGLSKLKELTVNLCINLHTIPDLPTSLEVLQAMYCTELETMPDFSEMSNMRELSASDSPKLTEIPGLDKSLNSMTMIRMEGCSNLTTEFRKNILQGWTSCGYGGIFLYGNYIPEWFDFVEGDVVDFDVPQSGSRNFNGLTFCCIYSSDHQEPENRIDIRVANVTKSTVVHARIAFASVRHYSQPEDEYLWQGQLSNVVLNLQGGDKVSISVGAGLDFVRVKKIGVNLVWGRFMKENVHDPGLHLYDFDRHRKLFSGADDAAEPSHEASDEKRPLETLRSDPIIEMTIDDEDEDDSGGDDDDEDEDEDDDDDDDDEDDDDDDKIEEEGGPSND